MSLSFGGRRPLKVYDDDSKAEQSFSFRALALRRKPEETARDEVNDEEKQEKSADFVEKDNIRAPSNKEQKATEKDRKLKRRFTKKISKGVNSVLSRNKSTSKANASEDQQGSGQIQLAQPNRTQESSQMKDTESKEEDLKNDQSDDEKVKENEPKEEKLNNAEKQGAAEEQTETKGIHEDCISPISPDSLQDDGLANDKRNESDNKKEDDVEKERGKHDTKKGKKTKVKIIGDKKKDKEHPPFGSRVKSGELTIKAKEQVLKEYPELQIERHSNSNDKGSLIVNCGVNSIKSEIIDLNCMVIIMKENVKILTHSTVETFFDWFPSFLTYLERYMVVEEEFLIQPIEEKANGLKGDLKPSGRMLLRGTIQRLLMDLIETQDVFKPYLPAGEKLPRVVEATKELTEGILVYWGETLKVLPPLINKHFTKKSEIEKLRLKMIRHVVNLIGYKDFLAVYTRWMGTSELLEWKKHVLLPCDYKFFSYNQWDKDMENIHYYIPAEFGDILLEENQENEQLAEESKVDFERAQAQRAQMEVLEEEDDDEFETGDFEGEGDEGEGDEGTSSRIKSFMFRNGKGDSTPKSGKPRTMPFGSSFKLK